jgi:hypothetical protein
MLFSWKKTKHRESSQENTGCKDSLSRSDPRVHCAGTDLVPSGDAAAAARRRGLKRCQHTHNRHVSASDSRQGPRAPRANSVVDKVATPSVRWMMTDAELHCYK